MTENQIILATRSLYSELAKRNNGEIVGCLRIMTESEKKLWEELQARGMINSCLVYGHGNKFCNNGKLTEYGVNYLKYHTQEEMLAIWEDQKADFKARCHVIPMAYTDFEGCVYNATSWDNDVAITY